VATNRKPKLNGLGFCCGGAELYAKGGGVARRDAKQRMVGGEMTAAGAKRN